MALRDFCIQYFLFFCFIILGISGLIVCGTAGYFIYQFHENNYSVIEKIDNVELPLVILIITGLLTSGLAVYFWKFIDFKYNSRQCILFSVILLMVVGAEVTSGIWTLSKFEELETMLSTSLEQSIKSPKVNELSSVPLGHLEIEINCCGSNSTAEYLNIWTCCDFKRHENNSTTRQQCENYYEAECRHMTINHHRSILHRVFLLALCSVFLQLLVALVISNYFRSKKRQRNHRRTPRHKPAVI